MKQIVSIQHGNHHTDVHNTRMYKMRVWPSPFRFGSTEAQALIAQIPIDNRPANYDLLPFNILVRVEDNKVLGWTETCPSEAEIREIRLKKESHYNADPPITVEAAADTPHLSITPVPEEEPVGLYAPRLGIDQPATPYIPATDDQV